MGNFYDTKDSDMIKMELTCPLDAWNKWSGQIIERNTYILKKKEWLKGESGGVWKWIKNIQATKHKHSAVTENKNIQSELKRHM